MESTNINEPTDEKTRNTVGSVAKKSYLSSLKEFSENIQEPEEETILPFVAPEGTKFMKIEIITQNPNTTSLKTFMAYLADRAGYLTELYEREVKQANIEIDKQRKEYELKLLQMRKTKDFKQKLKVPPERVTPEKKIFGAF